MKRKTSRTDGDSGYVLLSRYDGNIALIVAVRRQREIGY